MFSALSLGVAPREPGLSPSVGDLHLLQIPGLGEDRSAMDNQGCSCSNPWMLLSVQVGHRPNSGLRTTEPSLADAPSA
eukprot:6796361-Alexandrium_andersonii.AAC.1